MSSARYFPEFREEAVRQITQRGYPVKEVTLVQEKPMVEKEIYSRLEDLLKDNWQDREKHRLKGEGRVDVYIRRFVVGDLSQRYQEAYNFVRNFENMFCLDQTYCDMWGGLPDPLIVFQVDHDQKMVSVISHEDWFHLDASKPDRRFRKVWNKSGIVDVQMLSELNRELLNWVEFLIEDGFHK